MISSRLTVFVKTWGGSVRLPLVSDREPIRQPAGAKVDPDGAHAEVARYLTDPVALQAACDGDGSGSICDREQLHRLLLFRGFITKIKHNALRRAIPCTLRLISTLKFEVNFFAAISPAYVELRQAGPVPNDEHLSWFESEMEAWLTRVQPNGRTLVSDVLAHEMTIAEVQQAGNTASVDRLPNTPRFIGEVRVRRYETDVRVAVNKLSKGTFNPNTDWIVRDVNLVYHRAPGRPVSISEVNPFVTLVFSLVDGKRCVDTIASTLADSGLPEATEPVLHSVFREVAAQGLLEYGP